MRIAYVEDNLTNLSLVQRIAGMNNHAVVSYSEGEVALKELAVQKFDLILMDIELAGEMNGLQVVQALRTRGLTTPIVAVTAYAMMGDREKCLDAGCNDYLPKPIPIAEFLMMLARYDAAVQTKTAEPVPASMIATNAPSTPLPLVTIVEPHGNPVLTNAQSLPIHKEVTAADLPASATPKPGIGQPRLPAHESPNTGQPIPLDATKVPSVAVNANNNATNNGVKGTAPLKEKRPAKADIKAETPPSTKTDIAKTNMPSQE